MIDKLALFVDRWVDLVKMSSLADLRSGGPPPWATVSSGAAGHAYALWYVGRRKKRKAAIADGRRWWRLAIRSTVRRSAFRSPPYAGVPIAASIPFGRPGLYAVDALLAHDLGQPRAVKRAIAQLAAVVRRRRPLPGEYMLGRAGVLTAALAVHRYTEDPTLKTLADELGEQLLQEHELDDAGFAHGRVGVQHALLAWTQLANRPAPTTLLDRVHRTTTRDAIAAASARRGSWCNGHPGLVLLWARAFEMTADEIYRERARAVMQRLIAEPATIDGSLCCGLGGEAYAALALARIDQSQDWRARAATLCGHALAITPETGVFKGLSGLVCLAVDLTTPGEARFPLVEP